MEYSQKCESCNIEFSSEKPAKYCSGKCRVTAHRKPVTAENDFTREMIDRNLKNGDNFKPNWYNNGYKSKEECKIALGWYR